MTKTPFLSHYTEKTMDIYNELYDIIEHKNNKKSEKLNEEAMDIMLKYEIITPKSARKLIERNKVNITDDSFIDKYE